MVSLPSTQLPSALARQAKTVRLAGRIPALLAHPDPAWGGPAPLVLWLHGRTVYKELDNGRYLRWIRAGIAACAIDLPGHGERLDESLHPSARIFDVIERVLPEIDLVLEALADPVFGGAFDLDRVAIGGMSLGGMATLRRLCDPHPFACAAIESTAGNLTLLTRPPEPTTQKRFFPASEEQLARFDPMRRVESFRPIPLLALHSQADQLIDVRGVTTYFDALREHYVRAGASPDMLQLHTWPSTGVADEHSGFGKFAAEAKTIQTEFFVRHLLGGTARPA